MGVPIYDFAKFSEKLYKIKTILGRKRGGGSATDLLDQLTLGYSGVAFSIDPPVISFLTVLWDFAGKC